RCLRVLPARAAGACCRRVLPAITGAPAGRFSRALQHRAIAFAAAASRCADRHPLRGESAPVGRRRRRAYRALVRTRHHCPCRQGRPGGPMEGDDRSMRERLLELKAWIAPYATEMKLAASIVGVVVLAFVL